MPIWKIFRPSSIRVSPCFSGMVIITIAIFFLSGCTNPSKNIDKNVLEEDSIIQSPIKFNTDSFRQIIFSNAEEVGYSESAHICSEVLSSMQIPPSSTLKINTWEGYFYHKGGELIEALLAYKKALKGAVNVNEKKIACYCTREIAKINTQLGLTEQAKLNFDLTLLFSQNARDSSYSYLDYGLLWGVIGNPQKQVETFSKVMNLTSDKDLRAIALGNLLEVYYSEKDISSFESTYKLYGKNSPSEPIYRNYYLALKLVLNKKHTKANNVFKNAFHECKQKEEFQDLSLDILLEMVKLQKKNGDPSDWLKTEIKKHIQVLRTSSFKPKQLELYKHCLDYCNSPEAFLEIEQIVAKKLHSIKSNQVFYNERKILAQYLREIVEKCLSFHAEQMTPLTKNELSPLVELLNSVKSIELQINRNTKISNDQKNILKHKIDSLYKANDQKQDSTTIISIMQIDSLSSLLYDYNASVDSFSFEYPQKNNAVVIYFVGAHDIFYCDIRKGFGFIKKIPISPLNLDNMLSNIATYIINKSPLYYRLSNSLQSMLWPYNEYDSITDVTIIPDNKLYNLSFESLTIEKNNKTFFLIEQHTISYQFYYHQKKNIQKKQLEAPIVVMKSDFNNSSRFNPIVLYRNDAPKSLSLATSSSFTESIAEGRIVFLTTHGTFQKKDPIIHFSDEDSLNLEHIANSDCKSEFIVMNTCYSGVGKIDKVEGANSYAYALLSSGCNNTMVNLWTANNYATAHINNSLIPLIQNHSIRKAHQLAKLKFLKDEETSKDLRHPYYWAASVLFRS